MWGSKETAKVVQDEGYMGSWTKNRGKGRCPQRQRATLNAEPFGVASSCAAAAVTRSPPRALAVRRCKDRKELDKLQQVGDELDHAQSSRCRFFYCSTNRQHSCTRTSTTCLSSDDDKIELCYRTCTCDSTIDHRPSIRFDAGHQCLHCCTVS